MEPTDQQALALIDRITGDDFCADLDMRALCNGDESGLTGDLKIAHKKLSRIYQIAHSMDRSHSCHHVHGDWRAAIAPELAEMQDEEGGAPITGEDDAHGALS